MEGEMDHGRPEERLAFCYDRHEEITRYIQTWKCMLFCLPLNFSVGFVVPDAIKSNLIPNTFHKICIQISSPEA